MALLRAHGVLLGAVSVGTLVIAGIVARVRAADQPAAVPGILVVVSVLAPAIIAHGAVSNDLRSGVALLWLQKPVSPLRFYLTRGLDVVGLSILSMLALSGGVTLLSTLLATPDVGRLVLTGIPVTTLLSISVCLLVFAFSSWGTSLDALLAFFLFYLTFISALEPGLLWGVMGWVGLPLESAATIGRFFVTGNTDDVALSLARYFVFLLTWTFVAGLGVFVTTRSPLPRETSR